MCFKILGHYMVLRIHKTKSGCISIIYDKRLIVRVDYWVANELLLLFLLFFKNQRCFFFFL